MSICKVKQTSVKQIPGGIRNDRIAIPELQRPGQQILIDGKEREDVLKIRSLNKTAGKRAGKGKPAGWTFQPPTIERVQ